MFRKFVTFDFTFRCYTGPIKTKIKFLRFDVLTAVRMMTLFTSALKTEASFTERLASTSEIYMASKLRTSPKLNPADV
jgi:hypothetical protein